MTVLGNHTINETQKLIDDKTVDIGDFNSKRGALPAAPDATWDADMAALQARFATAQQGFAGEKLALEGGTLLLGMLGDGGDVLTTETSYQALLTALNNGPEGVVSPGGFQDIANRFLKAGPAGQTVDETNLPDPNAGVVDLDLQGYKAADATIKAVGLPTKAPWDMTLPTWFWPAAIAVGVLMVGGTMVLPVLMPLLVAKKAL